MKILKIVVKYNKNNDVFCEIETSDSLGFTKPAGQCPKLLQARYKLNWVIEPPFPHNVAWL